MEKQNYVTLKWGTIKSCAFPTCPKAEELINEYDEIELQTDKPDNDSFFNTDTPRQKEIVCELIDLTDGNSIYIHWFGREVLKKEAKEYVMTYGQD